MKKLKRKKGSMCIDKVVKINKEKFLTEFNIPFITLTESGKELTALETYYLSRHIEGENKQKMIDDLSDFILIKFQEIVGGVYLCCSKPIKKTNLDGEYVRLPYQFDRNIPFFEWLSLEEYKPHRW